jgi:hypothetical protein
MVGRSRRAPEDERTPPGVIVQFFCEYDDVSLVATSSRPQRPQRPCGEDALLIGIGIAQEARSVDRI